MIFVKIKLLFFVILLVNHGTIEITWYKKSLSFQIILFYCRFLEPFSGQDLICLIYHSTLTEDSGILLEKLNTQKEGHIRLKKYGSTKHMVKINFILLIPFFMLSFSRYMHKIVRFVAKSLTILIACRTNLSR